MRPYRQTVRELAKASLCVLGSLQPGVENQPVDRRPYRVPSGTLLTYTGADTLRDVVQVGFRQFDAQPASVSLDVLDTSM